MKVTDYIVSELYNYGARVVFGYTGGSIADLIDSVYRNQSMRFVQTYNEQGAAFAANTYAEKNGTIGVCVASSGPGAINLLNGIANAFFDSIPCVFITGNVHTLGRRESVNIRQNAFQETDIVSMVKGITKYSVYVDDENSIQEELKKAVKIALEGRKGPVLIDIPYDIQRKSITNPQIIEESLEKKEESYADKWDDVKRILRNAHRPLILLGGGCREYRNKINALMNKVRIPVVASMRAIDVISHENDLYIGFIGSYGNYIANCSIDVCDCLIVLGSRLDERQMGYDRKAFAGRAHIIRVDIDENELYRKVDSAVCIRSDIGSFIDFWANNIFECNYEEWINKLIRWKQIFYEKEKKSVPNHIVDTLSRVFDKDTVFLADVGQNQIICAQSLYIREGSFYCSAGLGCMGYSIPAAIGIYYADKNVGIVVVCGDGGFMMNLQELQTIKRDGIPLTIIVLNNHSLGLITRLQDNLFDGKYYASIVGYESPDLKAISKAWDMDYSVINDLHDIEQNKENITRKCAKIIEVPLPQNMKVEPEPGEKISHQISYVEDDIIKCFYNDFGIERD